MSPVVNVSVRDILGCKPGDDCPAEDCDGVFAEISISWTSEYFGATARCITCKEEWQLQEEHCFNEKDDKS